MRRKLARMGGLVSLILTAPTGVVEPLAGQEAPAPQWSASVHYDAVRADAAGANAYWHTATAGVQRRFAHGSIAVRGLATHRFGLTERALAGEIYRDLWKGAYVNASMSHAPEAEALPSVSLGGELYQSVGPAELAVALRHQDFATADVGSVGVAVGVYLGAWYLRPRAIVAQVAESWSPFYVFTARRYLGDTTDNTLDLTFGAGEEVLEVAPAPSAGPVAVATSGSVFFGIGTRRFISRHFGISAGASYSRFVDIPERLGASVGLLTRW